MSDNKCVSAGYIANLVNELEKWKKNREIRLSYSGKSQNLNNKLLKKAIKHLTEYRELLAMKK